MVVEARYKCQPVVLMFLMVSLLVFVGCGSDSTPRTVDQAIDQATSQLEIYGGSQAVSLWGHVPATLPASSAGTGAQQKITQISEQQTKDFTQAIENLKKFADQTTEDNRQAKKAAFAKWLMGAMVLYQGTMEADQVKMLDARQAGKKDKVLQSCLDVRLIKTQKDAVSPANFEGAVKQSQEVIAGLNKVLDVARKQLSVVDEALKALNAELVKVEKERDNLNVQVGQLTGKLANVPAAEGVKLQKQINDLEKKRFAVLVEIQKLQAGPLSVPKEFSVIVDTRKLTEVNGISQLEAEKAFLETRVTKTQEGINAQETYLKNLQQQMTIAEQKGQELAKQLTASSERLKTDLQALSTLVSERSGMMSKADKDLNDSVKWMQQADSDLKRYLSAVQQAGSNAAGEDAFLKSAQGLDELGYSIGSIRADAQLAQVRLKSDNIQFMESVISILQNCQSFSTLPENLSAILKDGPARVKAMKEDQAKAVESVVTQYESLYRSAGRSPLKPIIGAGMAEALSQAASLMPEKSKDYLAKAKEILGQVLPEGTAANSDPLLMPAKKLQQSLSL